MSLREILLADASNTTQNGYLVLTFTESYRLLSFKLSCLFIAGKLFIPLLSISQNRCNITSRSSIFASSETKYVPTKLVVALC